jgi:UDP-N-acetylglucosamine--N-acetylmuramyl-(pentapeptide) pyrophosphoryl-undecaprenol N-acetylglucosamine transferase
MTTVAIACGGTGGHLFPGLAVAEKLRMRDCAVTLLISPKEIDQKAIKNLTGMEVVKLPAVGLQSGNRLAFFRGFIQSFRQARRMFRSGPPQAALAMGGFTSAPPILAAKLSGARTFLHESNTIPGRANRLLARFVDEAFIGFAQAASGLKVRRITKTGTPVRPSFQPGDPESCRRALGLDPTRPVLLVMGGSQGASGVNDLVLAALPLFAKSEPGLQFLHLTGSNDFEKVQQSYATANVRAIVHPFFEEMHVALGAATMAISRSGASSLAELAATLVPSVLMPYPAAADNHQFYNAKEFSDTGAACLLEQNDARPETLFKIAEPLLKDVSVRVKMQTAQRAWQAPRAADQIADAMLSAVRERAAKLGSGTSERKRAGCPDHDADAAHLLDAKVARMIFSSSPQPSLLNRGSAYAGAAPFKRSAYGGYKTTDTPLLRERVRVKRTAQLPLHRLGWVTDAHRHA